MSEQMTREQVLAGIVQGVAEQREAARQETDPVKRDRMLRHAKLREDLAEEEAEAIALEIAENQQPVLTAEQIELVEEIARRVYRESA